MRTSQSPSPLNALLLLLDNAENKPRAERPAIARQFVDGLEKLLSNPEFEVTRDLFDGVSNDTRKAVLAAFGLAITTAEITHTAIENPEVLRDPKLRTRLEIVTKTANQEPETN